MKGTREPSNIFIRVIINSKSSTIIENDKDALFILYETFNFLDNVSVMLLSIVLLIILKELSIFPNVS
jgi:hypothetical protein